MIIRGGVYEAMDAAFGTLWPWQTEWWVLHGSLLREDMNRTLPTYVHDKAVFPTAGLGLEPCGQARLSLSCLFTGWKQRPRRSQATLLSPGKGPSPPREEEEGFWREANDIPSHPVPGFRAFLLEKRGGSGCHIPVEMAVHGLACAIPGATGVSTQS